MIRETAIAIALLVAPHATSAASQYYSVAGGLQFQIGSERPMPLQHFPTNTKTPMNQLVTKTIFPPQLLIPVTADPAKALIQQTTGPDPKQITIPAGLLRHPASGPKALGMVKFNPKIFQVRTNVELSAPAKKLGGAVLRAGGRTGPPIMTYPGPNTGDTVRYMKTAAQFGGPLQARIAPASTVRIFIDLGVMLPCKHPVFLGVDANCQALILEEHPGTLVAIGAKFGFTAMSPGPPAMSPFRVNASIPNTTGLIAKSASAVMTGTLKNPLTSAGFPWTTGRVIVSAVEALGDSERFTITGMDSRMNGIGTISLVSGALTDRPLTGPNGNRGWLRLTVPEPGAALGAVAALATLALCHGLARRR
jgi:hypothetical protein